MSRKQEFTSFEKEILKESLGDPDAVADPVEDLVTFRFINRDDAFVDPKTKKKFDLEFSYNGVMYKFIDGKVHTAPREVMEHLNGKNGACAYPVYSSMKDEDGNTVVAPTGSVPRFMCVEVHSSEKAA